MEKGADGSPFAGDVLRDGSVRRTGNAAEVHLTTWITRDLRRRVKLECVRCGIPLREFVVTAVAEALAKRRPGGGVRGPKVK